MTWWQCLSLAMKQLLLFSLGLFSYSHKYVSGWSTFLCSLVKTKIMSFYYKAATWVGPTWPSQVNPRFRFVWAMCEWVGVGVGFRFENTNQKILGLVQIEGVANSSKPKPIYYELLLLLFFNYISFYLKHENIKRIMRELQPLPFIIVLY